MDISNIGILPPMVKRFYLNLINFCGLDFPKNEKIKAKFKIDTDLYALVQVKNKGFFD